MIRPRDEVYEYVYVATYLSVQIQIRVRKFNVRCIHTTYAVVIHHVLPEILHK